MHEVEVVLCVGCTVLYFTTVKPYNNHTRSCFYHYDTTTIATIYFMYILINLTFVYLSLRCTLMPVPVLYCTGTVLYCRVPLAVMLYQA